MPARDRSGVTLIDVHAAGGPPGAPLPVARPRLVLPGTLVAITARQAEEVAVLLLLALLVGIAAPRYFGMQSHALEIADVVTLRGINSAITLYRLRHHGACPGQPGQRAFPAFLSDRAYFPDGPPADPRTNSTTPYEHTYSSTLCRVQRVAGDVNHETGAGH